ncbi:type I glutamate--ammonia ligase [Streptomyces osmaniensis]|uniref:Type I glutamate--ammonia ligase n=2 Tax=Streptomyces osmaniensis TaxID=593134 RepID=A0ABP6Z2E5_9ACTN
MTTEPEQIRRAIDSLTAQGVDVVRIVHPDLPGRARGKDILLPHLPEAATHGVAFCRAATYHAGTRGEVSDLPEGRRAGMPDIVVHPNLDTLAPLPWEPGVAWCIGDALEPGTGLPASESPRHLIQHVTGHLTACGLTAVVGPELEYVLLERDPASPHGWRRYAAMSGNLYAAGRSGDLDGHLLQTMRYLHAAGISATGGNREYAGGQFEINLAHSEALYAADQAFLFKSAVREIACLQGKLATFMAKPFNDGAGSGFHLHISMYDDDQHNVFDDTNQPNGLSATARHSISGVLKHAPALTALCNPTVNSYKRLSANSAAPWLIDWGLDNRCAMVRIPPQRGNATRIELRLPDASANPYLATAALIAAIRLGIDKPAEPPARLNGYGYDPSKAARLPTNLAAALDALEADHELTETLGKAFIDTFLHLKRNELERYQQYVTDWEFREYAR